MASEAFALLYSPSSECWFCITILENFQLTLCVRGSALPILRQLGTSGGAGALMHGGEIDFSMIKVWAGLEARKFFQASVQSVEYCVNYDLLSPNI